MDTINRIIDLQKKGMQDNEIIGQLQNEGISPKEIRDAFSQARVKSAVYQEENFDEMQGQNSQGMSPSIMQSQEPEQIQQQVPQAPQGYSQEQNQQMEQTPGQDQNYYAPAPQSYSGQENYTPQAS